VPFQAALFVVVLLLVRQARARAVEEAGQQAGPEVFAAPLSSALAVALLATEWIYPSPPYLVLNGVGLLLLVPVVLVVRHLAPRPMVPAVYALAAFFLVDRVRALCAVIPRLEQQILLVALIVGAAFLAFAVRRESVAPASGPRWWLAWMRLARFLGTVVVYSNYAGLVLHAGVRIGEGLVAHLLRVCPLAMLRMAQRHRAGLERGLQRALRWLGAGGWAYVTLQALGLTEPIGAAAATVLEVLRKTGESHPRGLSAPAPVTLCTGFRDGGLRFELRAWTARCEEAEEMRSELAMAVHAALAAAGIDIALPQHDVRIRTSAAALPGGLDHSVRLGAPS
jgi:hypothetical protein